MLPPRAPIPQKIADHLLYEADHTCCICHNKKFDVEIHHIHGRHDSGPGNLIVLCRNCHSEVSRKGGLGRRYSAGELKHFKKSWVAATAQRRAIVPVLDQRRKHVQDLDHSLTLFEVRRLTYQFRALEGSPKPEARAMEIMRMIQQFAYSSSPDVKELCVQFTYDTASWLYRRPVSAEFVSQQAAILLECVSPDLDFVAPVRRRLTKPELDLLSHCVNVAGEIAYYVCKYVRVKEPAESATMLLYDLLVFTDLNRLSSERDKVLHEFNECERICKQPVRQGRAFEEGLELLKFWKKTALENAAAARKQ